MIGPFRLTDAVRSLTTSLRCRRITRIWSVIEPSVTSSTVVISGLTNGVLRYFRVAAVNAIGTGAWSNVMSARPGDPSVVYLQSASGAATSDFGVTLPGNLTADSLLIASFNARSSTAPATISDTGGHTWTLVSASGPLSGVSAYLCDLHGAEHRNGCLHGQC